MTDASSSKSALQISAGQQPITTSLWPLITHICHVTIIVTGGFSKKSFLLLIFSEAVCMQMFFKTGVIRNFTLFTGKHLYFNLIPKETSTQVFPVKIAIFYKQLFL